MDNSSPSDMAAFWNSATAIDIWAFDPAKMMAELQLRPDPWQVELVTSPSRRLILNCSRQSGKTTAVACLALHEGLFKPHREILIFAPTERQSSEFLRRMRLFYKQLGEPVPRESNGKLVLDFKNGSRVVPLPGDEANVRGYTPHLVVIDEAARVADSLYGAIEPMLAASKGRLIALSTPNGKRGWFYKEFSGQGRTDWKRIMVPWQQCPRIDAQEIEQIRFSRGDSWVGQEFACRFEIMEGLVYPEYESCVIDPQQIAVTRAWAGADFGWHHPSAFLIIVADKDDVLYVVDEIYERHLTDEDLALRAYDLCSQWKVEKAFCDSANPQSITKLRRGNVPATEAQKAVTDGIRAVGARMRTGRLKVFRHCQNLIRELGLYHYDMEKTQSTDEPVKEDDHSCFVAGTIIETASGPKRIELITPGDLVWTRAGWRFVVACMRTEFREVWAAYFSGAIRCLRLVGTPDHPIWVQNKGWTRLDALRYGDIVETCENMEIPYALPLTKSSTGAIRSHQIWSSVATLFQEVGSACIAQSGKMLTALFRRAATFTTKTGTSSITLSTILNACRGKSTFRIMLGSAREHSSSESLTRSGHLRANGTDRKLEEHGIQSMGRIVGTRDNHSPRVAIIAVSPIPASREGRAIGSVPTNAGLPTEGKFDLTTRNENAPSAEHHSSSTATSQLQRAPVSVLAVRSLKQKAVVYNLTVEGEHEYFANGILVSNCDALRYCVMGVDRGKQPHGYKAPPALPVKRDEVDHGPDGNYRQPLPQERSKPLNIKASGKDAAQIAWEESEEARKLQREHLENAGWG